MHVVSKYNSAVRNTEREREFLELSTNANDTTGDRVEPPMVMCESRGDAAR